MFLTAPRGRGATFTSCPYGRHHISSFDILGVICVLFLPPPFPPFPFVRPGDPRGTFPQAPTGFAPALGDMFRGAPNWRDKNIENDCKTFFHFVIKENISLRPYSWGIERREKEGLHSATAALCVPLEGLQIHSEKKKNKHWKLWKVVHFATTTPGALFPRR